MTNSGPASMPAQKNTLSDYLLALTALPFKQWAIFVSLTVVAGVGAWQTAHLPALPQVIMTIYGVCLWLTQQPWAHPAVARILRTRITKRAFKGADPEATPDEIPKPKS